MKLKPIIVRRVPLAIEWLLMAVVLGSVLQCLGYLNHNGYLPSPYFINPDDTIMDWINVAYWSHNPGAYYAYLSVYPPISFDFLRLFTIDECYRFDNKYARDCDWMSYVALVVSWLISSIVAFLVLRKKDKSTSLVRSLAIAFGLPTLYALERGNLLIVCFPLFALGHGRLLKSSWSRWLALGAAINFKPYLILTLAPQLVNRRWRWLEGAVLVGLLVYLVSYALEGAGTPQEIISDTLGFGIQPTAVVFEWSYYNSTYKVMVDLLRSSFPMMNFLGSRPVETLDWVLPTLMRIGQCGVVATLAWGFFRPRVVPLYRLAALTVALAISSTSAGGYSSMFLIFLVFLEKFRGPACIIAIVTAYLLSISADIPLLAVARQWSTAWLTNRSVSFDLSVEVGQLVRPGLILLIEYALIAASFGDLLRSYDLKSLSERLGRGSDGHDSAAQPALEG